MLILFYHEFSLTIFLISIEFHSFSIFFFFLFFHIFCSKDLTKLLLHIMILQYKEEKNMFRQPDKI